MLPSSRTRSPIGIRDGSSLGAPCRSGVIGRVTELAAVDRMLERAEAQRAALVIRGEAGIGKSTVWQAAMERARERGARVLSARPVQSESRLALSGFGDLFVGLSDTDSGSLPAPQRQALDVALLRADPAIRADQRVLYVATTSLLKALAGQAPLLLAIDDVQWFDDSSARLIAYGLRRMGGHRVGVVVTALGTGGASPLSLDTWAEPDSVEELSIGPLSVAGLHQLLVSRLGVSFSRLAMIRIHAECAGNPFYALEVARVLVRTGAQVMPGRPLPVPESLAALTGDRIARLPPRTRRALVVTALALEPPSVATLERAGIAGARQALEPAIRDGVLSVGREVRFAHPLLATAALADVDASELRETHAALARVSGSDELRARHAAEAATGSDERVATSLAQAAERIRQRGASIAAGELLETAVTLTSPDHQAARAERTHLAAECYFAGGEAQRAGALLERLIKELPAGLPRARSLQLLGQVRARSMSMADALGLAGRALEEAEGDNAAIASIELDIAFYAFCLGDLPSTVPHARGALALAEAGGLHGLRADALACVSMASFWLGSGYSQTAIADAVDSEDPARPGPLEMQPRFVDALLRLWTGRCDEAVVLLETIRRELIESGRETSVPFLSLFLVIAYLYLGDLRSAREVAAEANVTASLNGEPVGVGLARAAQSLVDARSGNETAARDGAAQAAAIFQETQWTIYATWPLWAMGLVELALDRPAGVDGVLAPLADAIVAIPDADPVLGIVLPEEIEALAALGERPRAERYLAWLERRGRSLDRPWALAVAARGRGLLAAAVDADLALRELDDALVQHERIRMPFELARTLFIKGRVHRRRREKRLAHEALEESVALFEAVGAGAWVARARGELARVGLRPRAPGALTDTELRVAQLAAQGLTTRQVAEAVFLSPKSVDNVLGRVYRKLGIGSRAQLGASMAAGRSQLAPSASSDPADIPDGAPPDGHR